MAVGDYAMAGKMQSEKNRAAAAGEKGVHRIVVDRNMAGAEVGELEKQFLAEFSIGLGDSNK